MSCDEEAGVKKIQMIWAGDNKMALNKSSRSLGTGLVFLTFRDKISRKMDHVLKFLLPLTYRQSKICSALSSKA